jgi:hypothetical protein
MLVFMTGCRDPLYKDAQKLREGMTRATVDHIFNQYEVFAQGTEAANVRCATHVFATEQKVSYWISYAPKQRLFFNFESCKVYFDEQNVIVAYSYDRPN